MVCSRIGHFKRLIQNCAACLQLFLCDDQRRDDQHCVPVGVEKYAIGFHAGAGVVAPHAVYNEVHIYIQKDEDIDFFIHRLDLNEADQGANIIFCFPYYKHSIFYGMQKIDSLNIVSDIQLYLDLYKYPIRGMEQAEYLYEKRIKNAIEKI